MSENGLVQKLLFIYTETSLHAGTGSSVSAVDLPIQRERTTQYPLVQGSGVKGALRSQAQLADEDKGIIFGPSTDDLRDQKNKNAHAGAVSVGDARLVLFPVRSLNGVFAYATSPLALARLARFNVQIPTFSQPDEGEAFVTESSDLVSKGRVVLEEYAFNAAKRSEATAAAEWLANYAFPQGDAYAYWREKVLKSLIVLRDNDFRDFVVNSTEIITRVRLETATKTVAEGALWTQEMLPSDALLVSPVMVRPSRNGRPASEKEIAGKLVAAFSSGRMQLGGDETTGQGFVALQWI
jgi:CRISPR-associated protein Cmr4